MPAVAAIEDAAVADVHHPIERGRGRRNAIEQSEPAQRVDLAAPDLLHAEIRRVHGVAVDQHDPVTGATEHGSRQRATETTANDGDVSLPHGCRRSAVRGRGSQYGG